MSGAFRLPGLIIFLISLASTAAVARELRVGHATGRIRVLYVGDAMGIPNPFPSLIRSHHPMPRRFMLVPIIRR